MRYAISEVPQATARSSVAEESESGTHSIQFGDIWFHMTDDPRWSGMAKASNRGGAPLKRLSHSTPKARLHMVVQKGRLFQQEHPEVPVLLDKGRFLVVDMDARKAKKLDQGHLPCFSICRLPATSAFQSHPRNATRSAAVPWVQALVDRISRPTYEADLNKLVAFPNRFSTNANYKAAATLARDQLKDLGYQTRVQTITVNGASSQNVIADKTGLATSPRSVVIVGAHLDSINIAGGPTANAPGADDDGSGSAGVLAIARALKDHRSLQDIRFILFGGEEQGLFGSQQYVASLSQTLRKRILAVVHMDMIASLNTPQPAVLLEGSAKSQTVIDGLATAAATYSHLNVQTSLNPFNSDHVSFLNANIPAVLTIEGTDDANHFIHGPNDTLAHINFDLALDILRMNLAFVAQTIGKAP